MKDYKKKILDDIQKSGFPAEIDISATLEKEGWMVYNGQLFFDEEESKEREIDVHAINVDDSLQKNTPQKFKFRDICPPRPTEGFQPDTATPGICAGKSARRRPG